MSIMTVTMTMQFDTNAYSDVRDVRDVLQLARACIEGEADFPEVVRINAYNEKTNDDAWVDHHMGSYLTAVKSPSMGSTAVLPTAGVTAVKSPSEEKRDGE